MKILELGPSRFPKAKGDNVVYLDSDSSTNLPNLTVWDLEKTPLPFTSDIFDEVYASMIFEHIRNLHPLIKELHRIMKPEAIMKVWVPDWQSRDAWGDPTHVRAFTSDTLRYFDPSANLSQIVYEPHFSVGVKQLTGADLVEGSGRAIKSESLRRLAWSLSHPIEARKVRWLYFEMKALK